MTLTNWRDLAVVLLALEAFIMGLVPVAIFFFLVKGLLWLIRKLRATAPIVQSYFRKAAEISETVSQRASAPIIAASATSAKVQRWWRAIASFSLANKEV
jgi:hypothetical protein